MDSSGDHTSKIKAKDQTTLSVAVPLVGSSFHLDRPAEDPDYIPIRQAKPKNRKGSSAKNSPRVSPFLAGASKSTTEMSDLDFALQLSLAEEQSKQQAEKDDFPGLPPSRGTNPKGKGRWG